MNIVSSNPENVNPIESNEMALSKGLVGREALTQRSFDFPVNRSGRDKKWNWEKLTTEYKTVNGTISDVYKEVKNGYALCAGIFNGRRQKANFIASNWILVDIDNTESITGENGETIKRYEHQLTLDEALENPFIKQYCALIYTTASHTAKWHKFRLVFLLPETIIDLATYEGAVKWLLSRFPYDPACTDGLRVFFGSTKAECPLIQDVCLPSDLMTEAESFAFLENIRQGIRAEQAKKRREQIDVNSDEVYQLIESALNAIDPDFPGVQNSYNRWLSVGFALKSLGDEYYDLWDDWSANGSKYDSKRMLSTWKSFEGKDSDVSVIFGYAASNGWQHPDTLPVSDDWLENKQQTEYQFYCFTCDCKPLSFEDWKVQQKLEWIETQKLTNWKPQNYLKKDLTRKPDILLNERRISESDFSIGDHDALILSPKDTGKTTWLSSIVAKKIEVTEARREQAKIFSITHRKTLGSHLSRRLGLNWRNDNPNGLLMGSCIEGLAPLDVNAFNGCVLVIDEIDQVLRHLLTSATIKGNRPFYISAVKTLIKNASQIIGCSADTDDEIIKFIEKIRGKKLLLVKNEYVSKGYKAFFSASKSYGALYSRLKTRIENRTDKKVIYVASDSKNLVAKMEYDLTHKFPELRILTVTSKNSENKAQEEFMRFPNTVMASGLYDVILASPSLGTGVSFDNEDFDSVWGFFTGKSINAGDMAQSLFRVRLLCDRFIWCAEKGSFWKFGKTASPKRVRQILADRSNTNIDKAKEAVANGLKEEDFIEAEYLWKDSPFVDLYAHFVATNNRSSHNLRDELIARLSAEGHQLAVLDDSEIENATDSKSDLTTCGQQLRDVKKYALEGSKDITYEELQELQKKKEGKTEDDELAIEKYYLKEFYATDTVDTTLVEFDNEEKTRIVIKELENLLNVEVAEKKGVKSLIAATQWQHPLFPGYTLKADDHALWDADSTIARRDIRIALGLMDFFNPENRTKVYTKDDYAAYAAKAREMKEEIKKTLGVTVSDKMTDVQIVNGLLSQVGLKMQRKQIRNEGGVESTYSIEPYEFRKLEQILERRAKKYEAV